ncbi:PAS domain S-box protein [Acidobacteria bacterium AH-259-O06]|nr:PAS domain S-box protein [Acidobacteria bacterium AH-259-O06]
METPLRVLLVHEDEPENLAIIQQELERTFIEAEIQRVEIERDYFTHLDANPQAIISDYELPQFGALRALQLLAEKELDIPFIVIGEDVGGERAVECLKQGAADFLLKDRLARLGQVLKRVLQESKVQREKKQREASLRESVEYYRRLVELCPDGIALVREDKLVFVNRAGSRLLGAASPKQLIEKSFTSLVHPDSQKFLEERLREAESEAATMSVLEERFVRLDGEEIDVKLEAVPFTEDGNQGMLVVFRDITEQKRASASVSLRANLLSKMPDAVVAVDNERRIAYWNESAERVYGLASDEALGQKVEEIYQERWPYVEDENAAKQALETTGFWHGELIHLKTSGEELYVDLSITLLQDERGQSNGFVSIIRDITKSKRAEDTSKEERDFYSSVLNTTAAFVLVLDKEGRIILFNRACEQITGYSASEVSGKHPWDLFMPPEETRLAQASFEELKIDQFPNQREDYWLTRDGTRRLISWSDTALKDEKGSLTCVVSTGVDITERKKVEEIAKGSAQYFRSLVENAPDMLTVLDTDGIIRFGSPSVKEMLGYEPEDLVGKSFLELVHPNDVSSFSKTLEEVKQKPAVTSVTEIRVQNKENSWRVLEGVSKNLLDDPAISGIVLTAWDITRRKRAEKRIQRQLQSLDSLHAIDMATTTSLDLGVTLKVILEQVTSQLELDAASVLLFNPHTQILEYAAGRGFHSIALTRSRLRLGEGVAGQAALEQRIIAIPDLLDYEEGSARAKLFTDEGFLMYYAVPLKTRGELKGVLEIFNRSRLSPDPEWVSFLDTVASQAAKAIDNAELVAKLQRTNSELSFTYDATLERLSEALDLREQLPQGHSRRVAELTQRLGAAMRMEEMDLVHARRGALLHAIGTIKVPESILLKGGPLTDEEWQIVHQHPVYAQKLLSGIPNLRPALNIPYCHHEKWDGSGYPRALKGEEIPLEARIFAVVDAWDVRRSDRPDGEAWPKAKVHKHLRSHSGTDFDPQVVEKFLELEKEGRLSFEL